MSDDFEDLVKRWLRDRGATDRAALEAMAGHVAVLPPRRRRQPGPLAAAAAVVVAIGLAAFALAPRQGSVSSQPSSPVPPDPAAFAGDLRLARCGATVESAIDVFEMTHGRDYRLHLPAMLLAPELDVDAPGFVVVYRDMQPFPLLGAPPPPGQTRLPRSLAPGHHDVCILVGTDPATTELNVYDDVDIAGLTATVVSVEPSPARESASLAPATPPSLNLTPTPAPAWAFGAFALLGCDSDGIGPFASWHRGELETTELDTAEHALNHLLDRAGKTMLAFPLSGFRLTDGATDAAVYTYAVGGSVRAAVIVRSRAPDGSGPWFIADLSSCPASELGDLRTGVEIGDWHDPSCCGGVPVPVFIVEKQDCYNGIQLTVHGRLFVWDPGLGINRIYDPERLDGIFDRDATLPQDAIDTRNVSGDRRLFLAADGSAAYIVRPGGVQRWPHVKGDAYQRTECN